MKILITGGAGYVGSKLAEALRPQNDVEIFDRPKDILNKEELAMAIQGKDVVFHLAALAEINYTDAHPEETFDVNIMGLRNVVDLCAANGSILNFASTCCIYGNPILTPSIEDHVINPSDAYAMSKAAGEYIVKQWGLSKGLRYNILRFGTVYGPSLDQEMRGDMCIQIFLKAAHERRNIRVDGDGKQVRNFIHIDDLVRGLTLLNEKGVVGETINFAGKEKISVNQIAQYALDFGALNIENAPARKDDFTYQDVSIDKAARLLGWEPEISFEQGITDFFKSIK